MRLILAIGLALISIAALVISLKGLVEARADREALQGELDLQAKTIQALSEDYAKFRTPQTTAVDTTAVDDTKIKDLVHTEVQAEMMAMRRNGGGGQRRPQMDAAAFTRMLQDQVGLEEAKAAQVAPLLEAMMTDVRQVFAAGGTQEEMAAKRKDLRTALEGKTAVILSADEQTKFVTWIDERDQMFNRGRRNGGGNGNGAAPRAEAPPPATTNGPATTVPGQTPATGTKPSSF